MTGPSSNKATQGPTFRGALKVQAACNSPRARTIPYPVGRGPNEMLFGHKSLGHD